MSTRWLGRAAAGAAAVIALASGCAGAELSRTGAGATADPVGSAEVAPSATTSASQAAPPLTPAPVSTVADGAPGADGQTDPAGQSDALPADQALPTPGAAAGAEPLAPSAASPAPQPHPAPTADGCLPGIALPAGVDARACRPIGASAPMPGFSYIDFDDELGQGYGFATPSGKTHCEGVIAVAGAPNTVTCFPAGYDRASASWTWPAAWPDLPFATSAVILYSTYSGSGVYPVADAPDRGYSDGAVIELPAWGDDFGMGALPYSESQPVLAYGALPLRIGDIACLVETSGTTCWSGVTGHGFKVSSAALLTW